MTTHTIISLGLTILIGYAILKFVHKKILHVVVTGVIIFGVLGAFMHPDDVIGWASNTAQRIWPLIMAGAQHGTDSFLTLLNGISRTVR